MDAAAQKAARIALEKMKSKTKMQEKPVSGEDSEKMGDDANLASGKDLGSLGQTPDVVNVDTQGVDENGNPPYSVDRDIAEPHDEYTESDAGPREELPGTSKDGRQRSQTPSTKVGTILNSTRLID